MNKRGQITLFIIIGILLLFVFALVYYVYSSATEKQEISARPVVEQVPTELNPVVLFVEDCIKQTGERGLKIIGENGGYISLDNAGSFSYDNPTDADGVLISKDSNLKVPYWLYNKNPNNKNSVLFASLTPALKRTSGSLRDNSIEAQLDRYVTEELPVCLNNFKQFKEQGFKIKQGDIDTTTTVTSDKVTFFVEYPLEISRGNTKAKIKKFFTESDVALMQIYNLANEIKNTESEYGFLEENTLNLIELFAGVSPDNLPPMTDSTFEFGNIVMWPVAKVKESIKNMLTSYVPMLEIYNSKGYFKKQFPKTDVLSDIKEKVYENMVIDLNKKKKIPFKINFDYFGWPVYFKANDNAGIISPQSASVSFQGFNFGMQRYKTVYDISYPVIVTIEDKNALNGKGYRFNFGLETNIRNNRPVVNGEEIPVEIETFENSMMCNINQRNSGEYSISVKDNYNSFDLSGVQVLFTAGDSDCFIGETSENGIKAKFPIAYGGVLALIKDGYLSKYIPIDTKKEIPVEEKNINARMDKIDDVKVTVKKKKIVKCIFGTCYPGGSFPGELTNGWVFKSAPAYSLADNEEAIVTLERISNTEENFISTFSVRGDEEKIISLAPGKYKVNIQMALYDSVKIPAQIRCQKIDKGPFSKKGEKCFLINETVFDSFPSGGVVFDTEETYWDLKPQNLYNANKITFMTAEIALKDVPESLRVFEDAQMLGEISNISAEHRTALNPRIE